MLALNTCIIQAPSFRYIVQLRRAFPKTALYLEALICEINSLPAIAVLSIDLFVPSLSFTCHSSVHMCSVEVLCSALHKQSNNKTEQTKNGTKDFNDENLNETVIWSVAGCRGQIHSTYSEGSAASANAALLPLMPTETPQIKLHMPTVSPAQKSA